MGLSPISKTHLSYKYYTRWWFQVFFIFTPIWGRFPIGLIFFRWVETTNQYTIFPEETMIMAPKKLEKRDPNLKRHFFKRQSQRYIDEIAQLWTNISTPKNPWTLQWRGLNLCIAGFRVLKIAIFEGSGSLGTKTKFPKTDLNLSLMTKISK